MMWFYKQPVEIQFGNGALNDLLTILKRENLSNGMVVCQDVFIENGLVDRIKEISDSRVTTVFSAVDSNPTVENVDKCAAVLKENKNEFVIALGGGSVMDCAKAAASVCTTDDSVTKYHGTGAPLPKTKLPLIAVPTTSGTGSEVTCISVLTDHALNKKAPINSDNFYPDLALIDPELTYSMPSSVTAFTGIDVLCHALEAFWSKGHQPICDALALYAVRNVFTYLETACKEPENKIAREKMSEASLIAGLSFTIPKSTASHAISFPLTTIYHIPHGAACGLTIDYFARVNADNRLHTFAKNLGFEDAFAMADAIVELKRNVGLPMDLKKYELSDEQVEELIEKSEHPNLHNNPVEVTKEMLRELFNSLR